METGGTFHRHSWEDGKLTLDELPLNRVSCVVQDQARRTGVAGSFTTPEPLPDKYLDAKTSAHILCLLPGDWASISTVIILDEIHPPSNRYTYVANSAAFTQNYTSGEAE